MDTVHVALGEADFRTLVSGGVVDKRTQDGKEVRIILSDIGWVRMQAAILDAIGDVPR